MISPFTPGDLDLVAMLLRSRYLSDTHPTCRAMRAFACTGDFDLVCCGHDHRAYGEQVANMAGSGTWLANPGTVAGLAAAATSILADRAQWRFDTLTLPGP